MKPPKNIPVFVGELIECSFHAFSGLIRDCKRRWTLTRCNQAQTELSGRDIGEALIQSAISDASRMMAHECDETIE